MLRPADAYVAEFTRDVPQAKVLTVGSRSMPARARRRGDGIAGASCRAGAKIAEAAPRRAAATATAPLSLVVDGRGRWPRR